MAIANFEAASNTGLDNVQGDFLAKAAARVAAGTLTAAQALDYNDARKEDNQLLTVLYIAIKALRARARSANARDRFLGLYVGGHTEAAFLPLLTMLEPVYQEFLAAANAVDDAETDAVFTDDYCDRTDGPQGGPAH